MPKASTKKKKKPRLSAKKCYTKTWAYKAILNKIKKTGVTIKLGQQKQIQNS